MLCANIKQIEKHDYLAERFKKGYDFLKNTDLMSLPVGRVDIDGDDVFASVQEYITLPEAECRRRRAAPDGGDRSTPPELPAENPHSARRTAPLPAEQ